jgi:hypothetical protein
MAKSTADAEFITTATAINEEIWLHELETEFHPQSTPRKPVTIYNDNTACISNLTSTAHPIDTLVFGIGRLGICLKLEKQ